MVSVMPQKPKFALPPIGDDDSIGYRIARIRKSKALTQEEIASRVGITQSLFSAYERGRLRLSAEMVARIAQALDTSADEILGLARPSKIESLDGRLLKRLKQIEDLPVHQRRILITNIDMFLKGVARRAGDFDDSHSAARASS